MNVKSPPGAPRCVRTGRWIAAAVVGFLAIGSLVEGLPIVLDLGDARLAAGAYVPFVVTFNVIASLPYLAVGFGLATRRPWTPRLAGAIAFATAVAAILFAAHALSGGAFLPRTVVALAARLLIFTAIARIGHRLIGEDACVPGSTSRS